MQPFSKAGPISFHLMRTAKFNMQEGWLQTHVSHPGSSRLQTRPRWKDQRLHMAWQWQIYDAPSSTWKHCVFNLPSRNKSISSFCWRNCKSATLLHKDVKDLFKAAFTPLKEGEVSSSPQRHLNAVLYSPFHNKSRTSSFQWVYKLCYYI